MSTMTITKKRFNIILISIILVLTVCLVILIVHFTRPKQLEIYGYKKHYSLIYEDFPELDLKLYINRNSSNYFDKTFINKALVSTSTDTYLVKITDASIDQNSLYDDFYEANYSIKWDFSSDDLIMMKDAVLSLSFTNGESIMINIGNIAFQKAINNSYIRISKVQSIVADFGSLDSIGALNIELDSDSDYTITNIEPISSSIDINYDFLKLDNSSYISNETPLSELFGTNFNSYNRSMSSFKSFIINKNIKKGILIPLHYNEKELVDSLGLILTLEIDSKIVKQIINPYCLFSTSNTSYVKYEYKINKY